MTRRATVLDSLTDKAILRMAARELTRLAHDIRASHTIDGRWSSADKHDRNAKIEHDLARALAQRLREIAKAKR